MSKKPHETDGFGAEVADRQTLLMSAGPEVGTGGGQCARLLVVHEDRVCGTEIDESAIPSGTEIGQVGR